MPVSPDYLADYRTLGCSPGCTLSELERAWRNGLSRHHPDRAAPGSQADAATHTQSLNTAYRRLRGFAQQHGRLPGAPGRTPAADPGSAAHQGATPMAAGIANTPRRRGRRRLALAAVLLVIGGSWWLHPTEIRAPGARPAEASAVAEATAATQEELGIGSEAGELLARAGEPPLRRETGIGMEVWEYGPSMVSLRAGKVVDWYSSPMRPLPFGSERPLDVDALTVPPSRR